MTWQLLSKAKGSDRFRVLQMNRLTFGNRCSPFNAISVIRRVADDFGSGHPEVTGAIKNNLYMNLATTDGVQTAIQRAERVRTVLKNGDFNMRNWVSNSPEFLEALEPQSRPPSSGHHPPEATGRLHLHRPTSTISIIFIDPLGFTPPFIIQAKIKLKELNLSGLDWDTPILVE